jgi:ribosomal protein L37E
MTGGICNNCGFPLTKMRTKSTFDIKKSDKKKNGNTLVKIKKL